MKLIIDIPEETYNFLQRYGTDGGIIEKAVVNGTPLEKHDEEVIKETVASVWGKPPYMEVLDEIRAEIAKDGFVWVAYAITDETKTKKGIMKLVSDVLKQVQEQVLNVIDKYKADKGDKE